MHEKDMKSCLESMVLPGHVKVENVYCHPVQCFGHARWGMRESRYSLPGMGHVHDPMLRYNPMARRTEVAPWHVINEAKRLLESHVKDTCKLDKSIRSNVEDDVHFRRLVFKLYTR